MKKLWIMIGLLFIALPTLAQPATPNAEIPIRVPVMVEFATIVTGDDGGLSIHIVGSHGTGCSVPILIEQRLEAQNLIIEIYQEILPSQACPAILIGYDEVIPLEITPDETAPTVIVNGVTAVLDDGGVESPGSDDPNNVAPSRVETLIEDVEITFFPGREVPNQGLTIPIYRLHITGTQPDQCDYPVLVEQSYEDGWLTVEIYREIPPTVRCRGGEVAYETDLDLNLPFLYNEDDDINGPFGRFAIEVNDYLALVDFDAEETTLEATTRELVPVGSVLDLATVSLPPQPGLIISGNAPDGCRLPTRGEVLFDGTTINIEVYRPAPPEDLGCRLLKRLVPYTIQVLFTDVPDGLYPYNVNGITGEITIQGVPMQSDAPLIPSDPAAVLHVITDVQVLIMESSPPQIALQITGYQSDGCESEIMTEQRQDGNTFTIQIYRLLPLDVVCPQSLVDYSANLQLGFLEPGRYTFDVNGFIVTAEVQ